MTSLLTTAARRLLPTLRSTTTTLARTQAALPLSSTIPARSFATVNARLADIVDALPHLEAVRYDRQNNIKCKCLLGKDASAAWRLNTY